MNEKESSARATLLFLLAVPVCLVFVTGLIYDISNSITGQYSFTFSREYSGWQTGDGAVIMWIPTYMIGLFLELFPFVILVRAYFLRSSTKNLQSLQDPEILTIAREAAEKAEIDTPPLYTFTDQRVILDVFGTNKKPLLRLSSEFIQLFGEKPKELKALLLHEYSHILHKDVGLLTLRSSFIHTLGVYLLVNLTYQCYNMYKYAAKYSTEIPPSEMGTKVLFRILGDQIMLFLGLALLFLLVISIYREREFLADMKAQFMLKNSTLGSALKELQSAVSKGVSIEIFSDHPPIQKRIDALKRQKPPSSLTVIFWTALTLAFCVLLLTDSFGEITMTFFHYDSYTVERFYTSTGIWIDFAVEALFPGFVMLYLFRFERVKSFLHSVGKTSFCCGVYSALVVGYHPIMWVLRSHGFYLPEVTTISNTTRGWAFLPGVNRISDCVMLFFHRMNPDLPFRLKYAMREWFFVFLVITIIYSVISICIFLMRGISVQKVTASSKRTRLFMVATVEIFLILGGIVTQIPQKERSSTTEEWIMSFYTAYDYKEPGTAEYVKAGSFDFKTQYDIADNYYSIHTLTHINRLGNLTLNQRDELIRWLRYHQDDKGDFFLEFYFFELSDKASIWEEQCILMSLQDLNALDAIDKEGAIEYALSEYEDYPWEVFHTVQTLQTLDAVDRMDEHLRGLAEKYFLNVDDESGPDSPEMCYEGFYPCWETGWDCIICTYWGVLTVRELGVLDMYNEEIIGSWIMDHYTEDGGFCEELLIDWWSDPPETYQGASNLESTFYAVKALHVLNQCDTLNREKTIHYVLSFQTRKGGFARTPNSNPTFEDTFYAVEILDALDALDQLNEPYRISEVLVEIFHSLPLVFYICIAAMVAVDVWLYFRVWTD